MICALGDDALSADDAAFLSDFAPSGGASTAKDPTTATYLPVSPALAPSPTPAVPTAAPKPASLGALGFVVPGVLLVGIGLAVFFASRLK